MILQYKDNVINKHITIVYVCVIKETANFNHIKIYLSHHKF